MNKAPCGQCLSNSSLRLCCAHPLHVELYSHTHICHHSIECGLWDQHHPHKADTYTHNRGTCPRQPALRDHTHTHTHTPTDCSMRCRFNIWTQMALVVVVVTVLVVGSIVVAFHRGARNHHCTARACSTRNHPTIAPPDPTPCTQSQDSPPSSPPATQPLALLSQTHTGLQYIPMHSHPGVITLHPITWQRGRHPRRSRTQR
jgi:hypothetical protein